MKLFHRLSKTAIILGTLMLSGLLAGCGSKKEESYRSIQVYDIDGTGWVTREDMGEMELYANMQLQSNDRVRTDSESYVQLKLDEDKYVLLEPGTVITIVAEGDSVDSKTKIVLEEGAVVNRIENKLSENSGYEVETPTSTMAVRGTIFRVTVVMDKEGKLVSEVEVQEGKVECKIVVKKEDGTTKEETVTLEAGKKTIIEGTPEGADSVGEPEIFTFDEHEDEVLNFIGYSKNEVSPSSQEEETPFEEEDSTQPESTIEEEDSEDDKPKTETKPKTEPKLETEPTPETEPIPETEPTPETESIPDTTPDEGETGGEITGSDSASGSTNNPSNPGSGNTNNGSNAGSGNTNSGSNTGNGSNTGSGGGDDGSSSGGDSGTTPTQTYIVTFMNGTTKFATQTVTSGSTATKPTLMPTENGSWNFDFETPITANIDVTWNPTESTTP